MTDVTVIGLGAMGQALAGAFLAAGHRVTVWNRSRDKGEAIVARGAVRASTAEAAVRSSELVVVCVTDPRASAEILEPIADALGGRVVVDLGTSTPESAREAASWAARHRIEYLDGSIMAPTPLIGTPQALILYSGSADLHALHRATLEALAGNNAYLGSDHGLAALYDLALLDIFFSSMAATVHAFALVGSDGVSPTTFRPMVEQFFALLPAMALSMAPNFETHEHPGDFDNLAMEAAGVAQIIEASRARGLDTTRLAAMESLLRKAIAAGHGADSFSAVFEVVRDRT